MRRTHLAVGLAALLAASRSALAQGQAKALDDLLVGAVVMAIAWLGFGMILTFWALSKRSRGPVWQGAAMVLSLGATAPLWLIGAALAREGGWVLLLLAAGMFGFVVHKATREVPPEEG